MKFTVAANMELTCFSIKCFSTLMDPCGALFTEPHAVTRVRETET